MPYNRDGVWVKPRPIITVWKSDNAFLVQTPYNEGFVKALKSTVPYKDRKWNRISKGWVIHLDYHDDVKSLLFRYF